jgi:uncharacterized protein (DUF58 family)
MIDRFADRIHKLRGLRLRPTQGQIGVVHWWALGVFPVLLLVAVLFPYPILFHLAYLWGFLLLLSWLWVRIQGPQVALQRILRSDWAQVGDDLEERWELHNTCWLPLLWLQVSDASTLPNYQTRRIVTAGPHGSTPWTTTVTCTQRGRYRLGPLTVELGDPFGLFHYRRVDPRTREMIIYPPLVRLPALERPQGQRGGVAHAALLNILPTPNVGTVRDYRRGDPLNYIHWRGVAHTGKLLVKEFDQEMAGAVWIVLDLARATQFGQGADAAEELGIVVAGSLAHLLLAEGRTVGLFAQGAERHLVAPGRGREHVWAFMRTLVDARADGDLALPDALSTLRAMQGGRQAAVVITPDTGGAWAGALVNLTGGGAAALALLIAPADQAQPAAHVQFDRLGIRHATFRTADELPLLLPRRRTSGYRISPLGRAIRVEQ